MSNRMSDNLQLKQHKDQTKFHQIKSHHLMPSALHQHLEQLNLWPSRHPLRLPQYYR